MEIVLAALSELGPAEKAATVSDSVLHRELAHWGNRSATSPHDPRVLLVGLLAWTRVHGIISLEIEGFFEQVGVDPARLYEAEIDHLVAQRTGR
jgi:Tetracyclin repressor-like, C-terminal domain